MRVDRLRFLVRANLHLTLHGAVEIAKAAPDLLEQLSNLQAEKEYLMKELAAPEKAKL